MKKEALWSNYSTEPIISRLHHSMDILCGILSQLGIRFNCNYARDRLEGGEPRKPQLRIAAASVPRYAQMIGYISPARLSLLAKALGSHTPSLTTMICYQGCNLLPFRSHQQNLFAPPAKYSIRFLRPKQSLQWKQKKKFQEKHQQRLNFPSTLLLLRRVLLFITRLSVMGK